MNELINLTSYELALVVGTAALTTSLVLLTIMKLRSDALDHRRTSRVDALAGLVHAHRSAELATLLLEDWTLIRDLHAALSELPYAQLAGTCAALASDPSGYALVDAAVLAGIEADFAADGSSGRAAREVQQLLGADTLTFAHTHTRELTEMAA